MCANLTEAETVISCVLSCECGLETSNQSCNSGYKLYLEKRSLNTKFSTGLGFNRADKQVERQALGVSGSTFPLKTWL